MFKNANSKIYVLQVEGDCTSTIILMQRKEFLKIDMECPLMKRQLNILIKA